MRALAPSRFFPSAESADEFGLVCIGGELSPEWLLDAYGHGLFPWPLIAGIDEPQWWSPDPRAIFEFDRFHVSRRLAGQVRGEKFQFTSDQDFRAVIHGCATAPDRRGATWLNVEMILAYEALYDLGHAHSVEAWRGNELAGGVYGVSIGGLFAAESMFFHHRDASKLALVHLMRHLRQRGYTLVDIQQLTEHTASLGAIEISRSRYLERLAQAIDLPVTFGRLGDA